MKQKPDDQLTEQIRQTLLSHEEPYVLGSWERFQQGELKKSRNNRRNLMMAAAAVVLLALTFVFAWVNNGIFTEQQYAEAPQNDQPGVTENESPQPPAGAQNLPVPKPERQENTPNIPQNQTASEITAAEPSPVRFGSGISPVSPTSLPENIMAATVALSSPPPVNKRVNRILNNPAENSANAGVPVELPSGQIVHTEDIRFPRQKDWNFSAAYASLMNIHDSQTDFGTGAGFYADWNFTRNMSISSGVIFAQNQLKYKDGHIERVMNTSEADETLLSSTSDLDYMQLDFINLEIPLTFRYSLTEQLSVSTGISSVTYLKERYNFVYKHEQQIQVFVDGETATSAPETRTVTLTTSQSESEPSLDRMDWAAFYTFSFGYQQHLFKRYSATLEPFVKIPFGQISSRDISYTTGGIQLKISF